MKTQKCDICKKNYNLLTEKGICYYCWINKYNLAPTPRQYGNHDVKNKK